jgi:hypothetical protein
MDQKPTRAPKIDATSSAIGEIGEIEVSLLW